MKNIKTFIIGFLSATCLFLFIGATDYDREESQIGKYQAFSDGSYSYMIDTETGKLYVLGDRDFYFVSNKFNGKWFYAEGAKIEEDN